MGAYETIRKAMKKNEREVLQHIREEGGVYRPFLPSKSWSHALDRLEAQGRIHWSKAKGGYVVVQ